MATNNPGTTTLDCPAFSSSDLNIFQGMGTPLLIIVAAIVISSFLVVINPGIISGITI